MTTSVTTVIWLPVLRQDAFCENIFQQIRDTLGRPNGCYHQKIGIHISKIDLISGVADELRQECALGSAISLPEGVQSVGGAIEINDFLYELVVGQTFEIIAGPKPSKNQGSLMFNDFGRGELSPFFANVHSTNFACPFIQVREEKTVNGLVVVEVECGRPWCVQPFRIPCGGNDAFDLIQLFFVTDIKFIDEDRRAAVTVGRDGVNTVSHITPPLRGGPGSPLRDQLQTLHRS